MSDIIFVRGEKFDNAAGLSPRLERGIPPPPEPRDSAELTPEIRTRRGGEGTPSDTCPGYPPETAGPSADTPSPPPRGHRRRSLVRRPIVPRAAAGIASPMSGAEFPVQMTTMCNRLHMVRGECLRRLPIGLIVDRTSAYPTRQPLALERGRSLAVCPVVVPRARWHRLHVPRVLADLRPTTTTARPPAPPRGHRRLTFARPTSAAATAPAVPRMSAASPSSVSPSSAHEIHTGTGPGRAGTRTPAREDPGRASKSGARAVPDRRGTTRAGIQTARCVTGEAHARGVRDTG